MNHNLLTYTPFFVAKDSLQLVGRKIVKPQAQVADTALSDAISWLCRTHDVTGRRGSSFGFSVLSGWGPAYPETTGYILGTLLEYSKITGDQSLVQRAKEMADWEIEIQLPDGGVHMGPLFKSVKEPVSEVFDTGMVLHGWVDAYEEFGDVEYLRAGERAATLLAEVMDEDGAWRSHSYMDIPHTYQSRIAWGMLRLAQHTGDAATEKAGRMNLDWALSMQQENGWFESCNFKPGTDPNSHAIAYTLRGLLEGYVITGHQPYLDAVLKTTEVLMRKLEIGGVIYANYDREWKPSASHMCLTGIAQLGLDWMRLYQIGGDIRHLNAGLKAVDLAAAHQQSGPGANVRGALPGSFPIWGGYAPMQFPNWATKFLAEALMLRGRCLEQADESRDHKQVPESGLAELETGADTVPHLERS